MLVAFVGHLLEKIAQFAVREHFVHDLIEEACAFFGVVKELHGFVEGIDVGDLEHAPADDDHFLVLVTEDEIRVRKSFLGEVAEACFVVGFLLLHSEEDFVVAVVEGFVGEEAIAVGSHLLAVDGDGDLFGVGHLLESFSEGVGHGRDCNRRIGGGQGWSPTRQACVATVLRVNCTWLKSYSRNQHASDIRIY